MKIDTMITIHNRYMIKIKIQIKIKIKDKDNDKDKDTDKYGGKISTSIYDHNTIRQNVTWGHFGACLKLAPV